MGNAMVDHREGWERLPRLILEHLGFGKFKNPTSFRFIERKEGVTKVTIAIANDPQSPGTLGDEHVAARKECNTPGV